jgi:hypothetical protein
VQSSFGIRLGDLVSQLLGCVFLIEDLADRSDGGSINPRGFDPHDAFRELDAAAHFGFRLTSKMSHAAQITTVFRSPENRPNIPQSRRWL